MQYTVCVSSRGRAVTLHCGSTKNVFPSSFESTATTLRAETPIAPVTHNAVHWRKERWIRGSKTHLDNIYLCCNPRSLKILWGHLISLMHLLIIHKAYMPVYKWSRFFSKEQLNERRGLSSLHSLLISLCNITNRLADVLSNWVPSLVMVTLTNDRFWGGRLL